MTRQVQAIDVLRDKSDSALTKEHDELARRFREVEASIAMTDGEKKIGCKKLVIEIYPYIQEEMRRARRRRLQEDLNTLDGYNLYGAFKRWLGN